MNKLYRLAYFDVVRGCVESWYYSTEQRDILKKQQMIRGRSAEEQFFGIEPIYFDVE